MQIIKSQTCFRAKKNTELKITEAIQDQLDQNKKVLWLLSGGSAIDVAVSVGHKLAGHIRAKDLTVSLIDERFGKVGHKNSNWQQLKKAGFPHESFQSLFVLTGKSQDQTAENYASRLKKVLKACDYTLGLYGMGTDGHTSGMLPKRTNAEFALFKGSRLVVYYKGADYQRITTTSALITQLDLVVLFACGSAKRPIIENLYKDLPDYVQPVQLLKQAKDLVVFYGEEM
jgi:6-phosphogluconolactonase/glucosamine-6-phosphate isomerase/deaminase